MGVPAAAMELLEPDAEHGQLLGPLAGRGHEPHRDRLREPLDDEEVAPLRIVHDVRRAIAELRVDPVDVRVRRLRDVRVGGDDRLGHGAPLSCAAEHRGPSTDAASALLTNRLLIGT